uniref:Arrestin C-terminal-like domain-containing protein n=1 Tax=Periophthalmus magnuspinnatus TaxID=409849 RepID=A0A3B4AJE6_9GOBI
MLLNLKITYNPANNETNTFTVGDTVTGQVELELHKQCEPQSLSIKFKGKAEVLWTERHGKTTVVYHAKNKYFSIKHHFIKDKDKTGKERLSNFSMSVRTPSSFHADTGKIVYLLEAKLSRSMRIPKKDTTKLNYVTQDVMDHNPELKEPQHETKDKKLKLFNSGTVSMDVDLEKLGFYQGESIKVLADIQNNSTRDIKPKFCVYSKHSFFANGKRRLHTKDLVKEVGAPIPPSSRQKVTQLINIPPDMEPSIHNCDIIKVEHRLRILLDITCSSNPEIKLPIVVLPEQNSHTDMNKHSAKLKGFEASAQPSPQNIYHPPVQALDQPIQSSAQPQPAAAADSDPPSYGSLYPSYPHTDQNWSQF